MKEHKINIPTFDGRNLCGIVNIPTGSPKANIVMSHGLSGNKDGKTLMQKELCEELCEKGYKVLRFDYRGHGESGSDSENFCISGAQTDIAAAINQVFGVEERVNIIGFSVGGATTILYSYINPKRINALVLWGPVLSFTDGFLTTDRSTWGKDFLSAGGLDTLDKQGVIEIKCKNSFKLGKKFFDEMKIVKEPYTLLKTLDYPILTIHSQEDEVVKYEYSKKYGVPNEKSQLLTVKGPHSLEKERKRVIKATIDWFDSHL